MTGRNFYDAPLARAHAEGFAGYWDGAADWLADLARGAGADPFVVDLGCGDGRMLDALRARGVPGHGIEIAPAFVAAAQARGLDVAVADAASARIPAATLVIALGEVLAYEGPSGGIALEHVVAASAEALAPGGALVFDVTGPAVPSGAGWREASDWFVASRVEIDGDRLARRMVTFARTAGGWQRSEELHRQRLLASAHVEAALQDAGFRYERLPRIGEVDLLPGRLAWLARRD